jgi:hypothetical protein
MVATRAKRTVARELRRRRECRYGLRGVEVTLAGREGRYVILGSHWDRHGKLRLELIPQALLADYEADQASYGDGSGVVLMKASELMEFADRWKSRTLRNVPAADAYLETEWPVVCRCWC